MNDRTARRRPGWWPLVVATALVVTGCSVPGGEPLPAETTAAPDPAPSASASDAGSAVPTAAPSSSPSLSSSPSPAAPDPAATGAPAQALGGRAFTVTGTYTPAEVQMRLDVTGLRRRGELLDLTATLTNLEQDRSRDLRWQVGTRFAGPYRKDITSLGNSFSGAVLTDVAGKKRYLVAADSGGSCVCTVELSSTFVGAGQSVELDATYAAPPPTTTTLDVSVPTLGTFRDLPVS